MCVGWDTENKNVHDDIVKKPSNDLNGCNVYKSKSSYITFDILHLLYNFFSTTLENETLTSISRKQLDYVLPIVT